MAIDSTGDYHALHLSMTFAKRPMPQFKTDLDLARRDISNLTSPDALAAFLTRLGYDTDQRQPLTPEAVNLTADTGKNVKAIEQLAVDEEDLFRIVFVRLKSLTVKARHDLTRAFGKSTIEHLLILTDDFRTLEFLLIDRRTRESRGADGLPIRQSIPLTISIDRRAPARHQVRILRRMTWLGAFDGLDQYEKLKHVFRNAAFAGEFFSNRALFSDYYLNERLREDPAWRDNPAEAFRAVGPLVEAGRLGSKDPDFDPHVSVYAPILTKLGFTPKRSPRKTPSQPDYLLKDGKATLTAVYAYPWDRSLDGPDHQRDPDYPDENPGAVVVTALEEDLADWIIVTNGVSWRLYSKAAHSRATNFYEVDLPAAIEAAEETDPNEAFRYWWLFFRREAFAQDDEGTRWLDAVAEGSRDYAKQLGDRLKSRIFEKIFPHLAEGFLLDRTKRLGLKKPPTEDELTDVFEATLTLLYRLLFLLYAESRDLLPVRDVHYAEISLDRLKKEIAGHGLQAESARFENLEKAYSGVKTDLYDRLAILFGVMDKGDRDRSVPTYNGGLFRHDTSEAELADEGINDEVSLRESRIAQFLTTHKVPDQQLALALDYLARDVDEKTYTLVFIDYKSLEVRHLGSIYEGLLEFKLKIAAEDLTTKREKGKEKYIPFGQASARRRRVGEVVVANGKPYLSNDKAERKASGSYYTPDPIVKYIVEHAVGPVLDEKLEALRPAFRKYEKEYGRNLGNAKQAFRRQHDGSELAEREWAVKQTYEDLGRELVEQLFELRVLDPAMGSGHFLVEVVDFLTDRLLAFLSAFPINPVATLLETTRRQIEDALREQGLDLDLERLTTPVHLLKRHVLKRCVYGVDLNPMAVELAKVSLWLDAFTLGAPLSFLQHHLRCGNSLIGATFKDLNVVRDNRLYPLSVEPLKEAIRQVLFVSALSDTTAAQVKQSASVYEEARTNLSGYRVVFDLLTARHFGYPEAADLFRFGNIEIADAARLRESLELDSERNLVDDVKSLARQTHRFFHWELEFPEVFFAESGMTGQQLRHKDEIEEGSGGFDAVVGNPPYISAIEFNRMSSGSEKIFWKTRFSSAAGAYDIYVLFWELVSQLIRFSGRSSLVTPNKFLSAPYAVELRKYLCSKTHLLRLFDVSRVPVFDDPSVYPVAGVLTRSETTRADNVRVDQAVNSMHTVRSFEHHRDDLELLPDLIWGFLLSEDIERLRTIRRGTKCLKDICGVSASSTASEADAFSQVIVDDNRIKDRIGWPIVNTGTIDSFHFLWGRENYRHAGKSYRHPVLPYNSDVISDRRRGQFNTAKLIVAKVCKGLEVAFDSDGKFAAANVNFVFCDGDAAYYYLGLLNSSVIQWVYEQYFGALRMSGGYLQVQAPQLRVLPIIPYEDASKSLRDELVRFAKMLHDNTINDEHVDEMDRLAAELMGIAQ